MGCIGVVGLLSVVPRWDFVDGLRVKRRAKRMGNVSAAILTRISRVVVWFSCVYNCLFSFFFLFLTLTLDQFSFVVSVWQERCIEI